MKNNRFYKTIMLVLMTAITTFMITALSMYAYFEKPISTEGSSNNNAVLNVKSNKNLESDLSRIHQTIEKYYLWNDNIDEEKLQTSAIKGYVSGLGDEYTEYIPEKEMKDFKSQITGNFVGVGIYMIADKESGKVVIYYPIPNSPAEKAGIKVGDIILSVNDKEYPIDDFNKMADDIKGEEGTEVKLKIEREGQQLEFTLKREKIVLNPIKTQVLENNIGYLKLPSFDEDTAKDFKEKVTELKNQGVKSLIIDLRNNGGGIVDEATSIADYFLEKDKIIISTVNNKKEKSETKAKNDPIFDMPIVLIVNENTASASEILTCSLQENNKAKSVGTKTFGKGIIQSLLTLPDGSGIKVTTEEYYTPNGNSIHKKGINPTEEVKLPDTVKSVYVVNEAEDTQLKRAIELLK